MLPAAYTDQMWNPESVSKSLPKYPGLRNNSNLQEWEQEMELKLGEAKLACFLGLHEYHVWTVSDVEKRSGWRNSMLCCSASLGL